MTEEVKAPQTHELTVTMADLRQAGTQPPNGLMVNGRFAPLMMWWQLRLGVCKGCEKERWLDSRNPSMGRGIMVVIGGGQYEAACECGDTLRVRRGLVEAANTTLNRHQRRGNLAKAKLNGGGQ